MSTRDSAPVDVFISYSHKDDRLREKLLTHLSLLKRSGVINGWHDRRIGAGQEWAGEIDRRLRSANVILLLVSADFLASDYCYDLEMKVALDRHAAGDARVVPVILRSVDWKWAPFGTLQALPRDAKPISTWVDEDEAFTDVARGIRRVCEELHAARPPQPPRRRPDGSGPQGPSHALFDVFKKSGVPQITFVPPDGFEILQLAIAQPGRPVVIEGPSGIGKTTAVNHALFELKRKGMINFAGEVRILSARDPHDLNKILAIRDWHEGAVAIDDIHKIEGDAFVNIADYLKLLADKENESKKLIIIGIPNAGTTLIEVAFDLATRIDRFSFSKVSDDRIQRMIFLGERALNIQFDRRDEIVRAAAGSFNMAQYVCFCICAHRNIMRTQDMMSPVECDVGNALNVVLGALDTKFKKTIQCFAAVGEKNIGFSLLESLADDADNFLSLDEMKYIKPELKTSLEDLLSKGLLTDMYAQFPECERHIYYDSKRHHLAVDDPQMGFYLKHTPRSKLMRLAGEVQRSLEKYAVFVSYSRPDQEHLERLRTHFSVFEAEGVLDLWSDSRISPGSKWRTEIENAIHVAKVALLLVSADYLASNFVRDVELPRLLARARGAGLVIVPVIVGPCSVSATPLAEYQFANPDGRPLSAMSRHEQDELWAGIVETVSSLIGKSS